MRRAERPMVRKMNAVKLTDRVNTRELMERLGLNDTIFECIRQGGLRWVMF